MQSVPASDRCEARHWQWCTRKRIPPAGTTERHVTEPCTLQTESDHHTERQLHGLGIPSEASAAQLEEGAHKKPLRCYGKYATDRVEMPSTSNGAFWGPPAL
ncbi:hypothetical protein NDU88_002891 [Pleurodeles waltl]|uniref:Uncharacterized protein n=1 Tax=Pleurodeles waltl TaxID=8319 RepID=A0AAV7RGV7_PLEWA|nr:hypothetical protein NDU88_002891 [Pleurodeles waltl]